MGFISSDIDAQALVAHTGPRRRYVVDRAGFSCNVFLPQEYEAAIRRVLDTKPDMAGTKAVARFDWTE